MTSSEPLAAARVVGGLLRQRSEEIEAARNLVPDVVDRLAAEGLFRFWVPASVGGGEATAADGVASITELARHDGAAAWCVMIANTTGLLAGFLDHRWAEELFGAPTAIGGGFAQPVGRARPVSGGLEVSGRWAWGSGTAHCTVVGGGALLVDEAGSPSPRADGLVAPFVLFERDQVELLDTWHVLGLTGSGSTDYRTEAAFVPEGRWVQIGRDEPVETGPLYRYSLYGLLAAGVAAVAVGLAGRAVEDLRELASVSTPQGSRRLLAERASTQALVADAEATVRSSAAHLERALGEAWSTAEDGAPLGDEQRGAIRLAATDATRRCVDAVVALYRAGGGEAVYRRCGLERVLRDALVVGQHAMVADRTRELLGRLALGRESDTTLL